MINKFWGFFTFILLLGTGISPVSAQVNAPESEVRMIFYNTENLFHPAKDSIKNDIEFTPKGAKKWDYYRYQQKLNKIFKILIAIGNGKPPSVVGLCEIENYWVLHDLINKTPLKKFGYQIIHKESPDLRGIDVGIIYLPDQFEPFHYQPIVIRLPNNRPTREILYVKGVLARTDTIHFYVNHWPSRWGGSYKSQPKRVKAAQTLISHVDSIRSITPTANIILTGDFNDGPADKSIKEVLNAQFYSNCNPSSLVNLMHQSHQDGLGTIATTQPIVKWEIFDQWIVSQSFLNQNNPITIELNQPLIFKAKWLLNKKKNTPYRTYLGPAFIGGYSDHLPIFLDLTIHR